MANIGIWQNYLRPPKSVADYDQEAAQAQGNLLGLQTKRNELRASDQAYADDQSSRAAWAASGNDTEKLIKDLTSRGLGGKALEIQKAGLANKKTQAETGKLDVETVDKALNTAKTFVPQINSAEGAAAYVNGLYADPILGPIAQRLAPKEKALSEIPQDPEQLARWKAAHMNISGEKLLELTAPKLNTVNTGTAQVTTGFDQLTGKPIAGTGQSVPILQSADNKATNATHIQTAGITQAGENSRAALARGTQLTIAGMNPDGTYRSTDANGAIDLSKVSPEDMAAAYRYKTDGTLPPNMGRGAQGAAESRKIRSIASQLDATAGESPEDARIRQMAAKGDIGALNQMRKREVAVGANVKNFDYNADQVVQLSGKVDRTGVPIANAWINAGRRSVTGNPDLSAFDTAIKTTVNEFAQIVSGTTSGATAEGEKKKAEALLNAQQTPEQIMAVVNQMRIESQNRMKSFKTQRAESMPTNVRGGNAAPAPAAAASAHPPEIADLLKKYGK